MPALWNAIQHPVATVVRFSLSQLAASWLLDARSNVYTDGAAHFTAASSQYLSIASNATLQIGAGVHFSFAAWAYLDTKSAMRPIIGKWSGAGNYEYLLRYNNTLDQFEFYVSSNGTLQTSVQAIIPSPTVATWYFLVVTYDGTNLAISVNGGSFDLFAYTGDVFAGASSFNLGRDQDTSVYFDGRIDSVGFWKRVLTGAEVVWLYNGGRGRVYADLAGGPAGIATSLISWWDLDAASGATRPDSAGSNNLADSGTVTLIGGRPITPAVNTGPVGLVLSSTGNHSWQQAIANRPTYDLTNGWIIFDGATSFLQSMSPVLLGDTFIFFAVYQLAATGADQQLAGNSAAGDAGVNIGVTSANHLSDGTHATVGCLGSETEDTAKHYCVIRRNGSGTDTITRDGVDVTGTPNALAISNALLPLFIGADQGTGKFLNGKIKLAGFVSGSMPFWQETQLNAYLATL